MADNTKVKKTIPAEQLERMQVAAKAARDKRVADEAADPELKAKRLADAKAKRDTKKPPAPDTKDVKVANDSDEDPPKKRASWWTTATEEQKATAKAKAKAKRDAKKTPE